MRILKIKAVYILLFLILIFNCNGQWGFRNKLTNTATQIKEWSWTELFLPDYDYYLKAKITYEEYLIFVDKINLKMYNEYEKIDVSRINWIYYIQEIEDWWNPSEQYANTYFKIDNDTLTFVKYENGFLYLHSICY